MGRKKKKKRPHLERGFVFLVFLVQIQVTFSAESITLSLYK